jgi:hypothetical protein
MVLLMKKLFVYILIFIFNFNQISYSSAIKSKKHIGTFLNKCSQILDFEEYRLCVFKNIMDRKPDLIINNIIKNKKESDLINLFEILEIINFAKQQEFITNEVAFDEWLKILNSNYKKKIKKTNDLNQTINSSPCLVYEEFDRFIKCFYKDFRTLTIYESADIITKRRIETIMLNSLNLDNESFIILLDKENLFDKSFDLDEGFEYFFTTMNGFGTDFYNKRKLDIDYKRIITFIIIAVIVALIAKKLLTKGSIDFTSSSSSSASSSASSGASKNYLYKNLPKSHILQKPWFRYGLRLRGLY